MQNKSSYLSVEFFITGVLLFLMIFLFRNALHANVLYIYSLVLSCGLIFARFSRDKYISSAKIITTIVVLCIFIWMAYSILASSFAYKDVMLICAKGALSIEVVLSFASGLPAFLTYMQLLSIPLLMNEAVFIKELDDLSIFIILGCFICWLAILKIKFYSFFDIKLGRGFEKFRSIAIFLLSFLTAIVVSRAFLLKFPLGEIKKGGLFSEGGPGGGIEKEDQLQKEYYYLQDAIQRRITRLVASLDSAEEKYEILTMLSKLIKDPASVIEVDKAEEGLIDLLKRPGLGLEKKESEELSHLIKDYISKKASFSQKDIDSKITDIFKDSPLNINDRLSVLNALDKLKASNSEEQLNKGSKRLEESVGNSSLNNGAKERLNELAKDAKNWKTFDIYRRKKNELADKDEFSDLISDISKMDNLASAKEIEDKIKGASREILREQWKDIGGLEELFDLKLDMFLHENEKNLKEKLAGLSLPERMLQELKDSADKIKNAQGPDDLSEKYSDFKDRLAQDNLEIPEEADNLLEAKLERLIREKKSAIKEALSKGIVPVDLLKEFTENMEKIESDNEEELDYDSDKLKEELEKICDRGLISNKSKKELLKEIEDFKNLIASSPKAGSGDIHPDYKKELTMLIESSSLNRNTKELLNDFVSGLLKTETFPQLENIKKAFDKEIGLLLKGDIDKGEIRKINDYYQKIAGMKKMFIMDKALFNLNKKAEGLGKLDHQRAQILNKYLRQLRDSANNEELKENMSKLKAYLEEEKIFEEQLTQDSEPEEGHSSGPWRIQILSSPLVIPVESSVPLKATAIYYNNISLKDVSPELEWSSLKPEVAWVDEKGMLHPISKGRTKIRAKYRGESSESVEISVVDKIPIDIERAIKETIAK